MDLKGEEERVKKERERERVSLLFLKSCIYPGLETPTC